MRNIIPILIVASTVLAGCHSPSKVPTQTAAPTAVAPQPFRPMFVTTRGTNSTPGGPWSIAVSPDGGSLHMIYTQELVGDHERDVITLTTSPAGWKAQPGWFVYIQSETNVWAYDGDRSLILHTQTPGRHGVGGCYGPRRFPCAVPPEVFSRLSEPAQKAIEKVK